MQISFRLPGFGGKPKVPAIPKEALPPPPPPPAPMPDPEDPLLKARSRRKAAASTRTGRASTIFSDSYSGETLG